MSENEASRRAVESQAGHFRVRICRVDNAEPIGQETTLWVDHALCPYEIPRPGIASSRSIAPSCALVQWFAFDPANWYEFCRRYRLELADKTADCERLVTDARERGLLLCYRLGDPRHNIAVALRAHLVHLECCYRWEAGLMIGGHATPLKREIEQAGGLWFPRHKAWMMPDREAWQRIHDQLPGDF